MQQDYAIVKRERFDLIDSNQYLLQGTFPKDGEVKAYLDGKVPVPARISSWENVSALERFVDFDSLQNKKVTVRVDLPENLSEFKLLSLFSVVRGKRVLWYSIQTKKLIARQNRPQFFLEEVNRDADRKYCAIRGWTIFSDPVEISVYDAQKRKINCKVQRLQRPDVNEMFVELQTMEPCGFYLEISNIPTLDFLLVFTSGNAKIGKWISFKTSKILQERIKLYGDKVFYQLKTRIAFAAMEHGLTFIEKRLCKEFFGVSKACCRWLSHFRIKPKGILYNAVDIKKIESAIQNPVCSFKDKLCLSDDTLIITFTGRLLKEKGILNLTEAVNQLPAELNACLLIAGDGDEMDNVKKQSGIRVKVLGRLSFEEVAALLRETDIFCLPTEYPEGFPTSVLEAAAAGCYVITTDKGGSKELIRDKSYGRILTEATPKKICDAIVEAALNESLRKNASVRAEERVRQMFTWEHTAKQVHALAENNVGDRT